jgi:hypothetical protein
VVYGSCTPKGDPLKRRRFPRKSSPTNFCGRSVTGSQGLRQKVELIDSMVQGTILQFIRGNAGEYL